MAAALLRADRGGVAARRVGAAAGADVLRVRVRDDRAQRDARARFSRVLDGERVAGGAVVVVRAPGQQLRARPSDFAPQ